MKTINQGSLERKTLMAFPGDESFQIKSPAQAKKINTTHPDYDSREQTTDEKCVVCDLGI